MTTLAFNEQQFDGAEEAPAPSDELLNCLAFISQFYGDERTLTSWRQGLPVGLASASVEIVLRAAEEAGYTAALLKKELADIKDYFLPAIVMTSDGRACVWTQRTAEGLVEVMMPEGDRCFPLEMSFGELAKLANGYVIFIKPPMRRDDRAGEHLAPKHTSWFCGTLWRFRSYYINTILAAILVNVLALAGTFFTMNVYDRVVPNQAYATLWSLAIGVTLAMLFEFAGRQLRTYLVDIAGKKADLIMGSIMFRQALDRRLEKRPGSSGVFANHFREFESLRDFVSSATVAALTDLPFVLLFVVVIAMIGGQLAWVLVAVIPLIVLIGYFIQKPLGRYMRENMREGSLKQGLLIESLEGIETLKAINGQGFMQKRWEDWSALSASSSMKSKMLSSWAMNLVNFVQQVVTIILVVWGVYLIADGKLSMGALIGVVMLAGRVVGPMAQVVGLAIRYQQAKVSLDMLNALMAAPGDRIDQQNYLPRRKLDGGIEVKNACFSYPDQKLPALSDLNIAVLPGESIAILGRIGSGKSTLLRLLNGLFLPTEGSILADGVDLRQIDPADVRHNISLVTQECKLFYGTLRENIMMAAPHVSPDQFLRVARMIGLDALAARHPLGFEMEIGEGGKGLSGGQQQLVALARSLLAEAQILLMDEPTSAMDGQTEAAFITQLQAIRGNRTLIISTHRFSLLSLVSRVIVLDNGKVVADGPKDTILAALTGGQIAVPK